MDLCLLADICGMCISVEGRHVSYVPSCDFGDSKSFQLNDVTPDICELLASIVSKVKDNLLRARFVDVVSMRRKGERGDSFIGIALDAYCNVEFYNLKTWRLEGCSRWQRTIDLAKSPRAGDKGIECILRTITEKAVLEIAIEGEVDPDKLLDVC